MNSILYPKLALTNLAKNRSTYFPYMLTSIVCIMTSYSVVFISTNEGLAMVPGGNITLTMFFLATLVIDLFCILLMFYTNSFLIKRRKKELGLYCVLGMEKRHVALVLFFETLFTAIVCLILGLLFGILFARLMFLALLYILDFATPFAFSISLPGVASTVVLFLCIYGATLAYNLRSVRMAKPVELLSSTNRGEKEPKTSWVFTLVGLLSLGFGYFLAVTVKNPIQALLWFFAAVVLVIIGTYCLFTSGSIALLKTLRHNKHFYYKPNNFISVSGMLYRMKQNASGLASICILSTMVLVTVSSTLCLYMGRTDMLHSMFPREITTSFFIDGDDSRPEQVQAAFTQALADAGLTAEKRTAARSLTLNVLDHGGAYGIRSSADEMNDAAFSLVPLSDYNAAEGAQPVSLAPDEALLYPIGDFGTPETLNLGGQVVRIVEVLREQLFSGVGTYDGATGAVLVVPDDQVRPLYSALYGSDGAGDQERFYYSAGFDVPGATNQQKLDLALDISARVEGIRVNCRSEVAAEWDSMYGCFLFLGIFFGILFLMATVLIIYYKQISEGFEDHDRFIIMQKVGMSQKEVRRATSKQILTVFFLPLGAAALHMAFAFPLIRRVLMLFSLNNVGLFFACTGATFLIFAVVYIFVYRATARVYYRLANA